MKLVKKRINRRVEMEPAAGTGRDMKGSHHCYVQAPPSLSFISETTAHLRKVVWELLPWPMVLAVRMLHLTVDRFFQLFLSTVRVNAV